MNDDRRLHPANGGGDCLAVGEVDLTVRRRDDLDIPLGGEVADVVADHAGAAEEEDRAGHGAICLRGPADRP